MFLMTQPELVMMQLDLVVTQLDLFVTRLGFLTTRLILKQQRLRFDEVKEESQMQICSSPHDIMAQKKRGEGLAEPFPRHPYLCYTVITVSRLGRSRYRCPS